MRPKTVAVIAGTGLTAVALGVGIGFRLKGSAANSDANDLLSQAESKFGSAPCSSSPGSGSSLCSDIASKHDQRNRANGISNVSFVAAGVFAAGTVAVFALWPESKDKRAGVRVAPWVSSNTHGMFVGGNF